MQACDDLLTRSGVLLPRPLMSRNTLPDKGIRLLESLIEPLTLDSLPLAVVVADCLEILAGRGVGLQARHIEQFRQLCLEAIEREAPIQPRVELGLALGRLGDPRIVDNLRDHTDPRARVQVPAGQYTVGGGEAYVVEPLKKQKFKVKKPFLISRYPVTNSQFRRFVQDGGYEQRQWWSEEGRQWREQQNVSEPEYWRQTKWNGANQPVVGVSFWEAEAFARWAGGRLPSELECEAAARGPQAFVYPWGNDWQDGICNTDELKLQKTTPVGLFPRSRSNPLGLEDLAGNVLEWCSDPVKVYSSVGRVVPGGGWLYSSVYARSDVRDWDRPDYRIQVLGFRVVSAFSPALRARPSVPRGLVGASRTSSRALLGLLESWEISLSRAAKSWQEHGGRNMRTPFRSFSCPNFPASPVFREA